MKKISLFIALMISVLVLSACSSTTASTAETDITESQPMVRIFEGELVPSSSLDQSFGISGQVEEILVDDGQQVEWGQVLARLAIPADVNLTLARAEQELLLAQQALATLPESADLALAQQRLAVLNAENQVEEAQEKIDDEASEENQAALTVAVAQLELAKAVLEQLESGDGINPDLTEAAQMRLKTAETSLTAAKALFDAYELKATTAGTVVDAALQVGQRVSAGQPVFTLADYSTWLVKTDNLTEIDVASVELGQKVAIFFDAVPDLTITGEVVDINMRSEIKRGDTTYTVTIRLENGDPSLRWGMTATVHMEP